jgi:hypothetical protein
MARAYCTVGQAREVGANPTDDAGVTAAIEAATARVEVFTGDQFLPDTVDVHRVLPVNEQGWCSAPRIISITSVTLVGAPGSTPVALPTTAYRVSSGSIPGQIDGIQIFAGYVYGSDPLIVGAEPWNGGWAYLLGGVPSPKAQADALGRFGWSTCPIEVAQATALVAALIAPTLYAPSADAEGNPTGVPNAGPVGRAGKPKRVSAPPMVTAGVIRTTGSAEADQILRAGGYRSRMVKVG